MTPFLYWCKNHQNPHRTCLLYGTNRLLTHNALQLSHYGNIQASFCKIIIALKCRETTTAARLIRHRLTKTTKQYEDHSKLGRILYSQPSKKHLPWNGQKISIFVSSNPNCNLRTPTLYFQTTDFGSSAMALKLLTMASRRAARTLTSGVPAASFSTAAARAEEETVEETVEGITMKGVKIAGRPLYLDMQATSPVDPRVLDDMLPYYMYKYGNPHSRTHLFGWESDTAVEKAREQVAALIGASPKEIIFTSGATESNNISVKGVMHFFKDKKRHVITTQTEHKCVLDSCRHLQQEGFEVTYLPVKKDGLIDIDELRAAIRPDTGLVSVMTVHNEIGVIQPIAEIGEICRQNKIFLHTDAAQAAGKIPVNVDEMKVDLMSLSGHKIYGPKGIGALYMRRRPRVRVEPQMNGGGQERGIRSGTVATPLAVGMGAACELAMKEMAYDQSHVSALQERLLSGIKAQLDGVEINGSAERRYAGNLNLSFAYVEGESLLMGLKEVAVSSGSACTSASLEPSYVLRALGVEEDMAHTSIRFGIGRFTTPQEIDRTIKLTVDQVQKLREMSPLWEMVKEGIDIKNIQWSQH